MGCHGGLRGDLTWPKHSELGRFLAMHPVGEITLKRQSFGFSSVTDFHAEARYGMYLAGSEAYCNTPEEAIKRAVLRVRAKAGHPEEYQEDEKHKRMGLGVKEKPECLICAKERKRVYAQS